MTTFNTIKRNMVLRMRYSESDIDRMIYAERNAGAYVFLELPRDVERELLATISRDGSLHMAESGTSKVKNESPT